MGLGASYVLESATTRNLCGGFSNEKDLGSNPVHAGDVAWAAAQQPGSTPEPSGGQAGSQGQANVPVTEGCLGGSEHNFTITDKAGTTYKLNIPPTADTSKLPQHVGESVQVAGNVKDTGKAANASIDVQGIGRGTGKCPAGGSRGAEPPPKQ